MSRRRACVYGHHEDACQSPMVCDANGECASVVSPPEARPSPVVTPQDQVPPHPVSTVERPATEAEVVAAIGRWLEDRAERAFGYASRSFGTDYESRWNLVGVHTVSLAKNLATEGDWRRFLPPVEVKP